MKKTEESKPYVFTQDDFDPSFKHVPIQHISNASQDAMEYVHGRAHGHFSNIKTPYIRLNEILGGGLEIGTITVIGARPAIGKTLLANTIAHQALELNAGRKLNVLDFQFEMLGRNVVIRDLAGKLKIPVSELKSNNGVYLQKTDIDRVANELAKNLEKNIYMVDTSMDTDQIYSLIKTYFSKMPSDAVTIATFDHTMLIRQARHQKSAKDKLEALGDLATATKKEFPMAWLLLSQLNREIMGNDRQEIDSVLNKPRDTDLFGADAILQHADNVILLDDPLRRNLLNYSEMKFELNPTIHKDYLCFHLVKAREGKLGMWWVKRDGATNQMHELTPSNYPPSRLPSDVKTRMGLVH